MDVLRNKGRTTRMLILRGIVIHKRRTATAIAEFVGMTPQGASEYISEMGAEGLIERDRGEVRSTVKGVEQLQTWLLALKGFVDQSIGGLEIVRSTDAIAERDIRKGEGVYLTMRKGLLFAGSVTGTSRGVAESDARANEMVQISDLSGVLDMKRHPIRLVTVPPARAGGGRCAIKASNIARAVERWGVDLDDLVIAALDLEGAAMLIRSGTPFQLEMPDPSTLVGYQERGRPIVAFGTPHSIAVLEERALGGRTVGGVIRDVSLRPV